MVSKLPEVGTTIFAIMSKLASEHGAINLSQGFPDFPPDPHLLDCVARALGGDNHQYAPMPGLPSLCAEISAKVSKDYGWTPDADTEITITAGGTQAIYSGIGALVSEGDEVIVIEPSYDSYIPSVLSFGGVVKTVSLKPPEYRVDWDQVERLITPKTKVIMTNTPHNPCGVVFQADDLLRLQDIVGRYGLWHISDEVYEHIIFDRKRHESALRYKQLYDRSLVIFSFGKSLHVTGWKTGYVIAPPELTREFRKIHQFNVFSVNRPLQTGIAEYMRRFADFGSISSFYQEKRDMFLELMKDVPLQFLPCHGSYFILADYGALADEPDRDYAKKLTIEAGVATIPLSPFYQKGSNDRILRFCFAKEEKTLREAADRLKNYFKRG